jgi:hypothetical protein
VSGSASGGLSVSDPGCLSDLSRKSLRKSPRHSFGFATDYRQAYKPATGNNHHKRSTHSSRHLRCTGSNPLCSDTPRFQYSTDHFRDNSGKRNRLYNYCNPHNNRHRPQWYRIH